MSGLLSTVVAKMLIELGDTNATKAESEEKVTSRTSFSSGVVLLHSLSRDGKACNAICVIENKSYSLVDDLLGRLCCPVRASSRLARRLPFSRNDKVSGMGCILAKSY